MPMEFYFHGHGVLFPCLWRFIPTAWRSNATPWRASPPFGVFVATDVLVKQSITKNNDEPLAPSVH